MTDPARLYIEGLDRTLYRLLDADTRTKKEAVETALTKEYGGEKRGALDVRIEHRRQRISMIEDEISDLRDELEEEREELEALQEQREALEDQEKAFETDVDELLDKAEKGEVNSLVPEYVAVREVAEDHGVTPDDLHQMLIDRAIDQEREISAQRFDPAPFSNLPDEPIYRVGGDQL